MTAPNTWTETMLALQSDMTRGQDVDDQLRTILEATTQQSDLMQYIAGDAMLMALERIPHGNKMKYKERFASVSGIELSALESYCTVCAYWRPATRWKLIDRYPNITFSYLKESVSYARSFGAWSAVDAMRKADSVQDLKRRFSVKRGNPKPKYKLILDSIGHYDLQGLDVDGIHDHLDVFTNYRVVIYEILE